MRLTTATMPTGTFAFPTRVIFGPGVTSQVADQATALKIRQPLLVTDAGMIEGGLLDRVVTPLRKAGIRFFVFDGVESNPTESSVTPGVDRYRADHCDGIIALGGGSVIDAAKAVRLAITHTRPLADYDDLTGGDRLITADMPPMIAIATTSGTGSEVSRSTVIELKATGRKTVIFSPHLLPTLALADPLLTVGLPAPLTAWTGMDALAHNIEAYLAKGFHPMCDAIALRGVELIGTYLRRAVDNGADEEARGYMMIASIMGAVAFQKGLGATHSLAHPLSSVAGLHHGLANAIMLPHVLTFNRNAAPERLSDVANMLGAVATPDNAAAEVRKLITDIGIPRRLSDVGVKTEMVAQMARLAEKDGCHALNPRHCTAADFERLYREAQ